MANEKILTADGSHSLRSEQFGVSYHSVHGAIQETQHVFIDAALRPKAVIQRKIKILEIGFGTGLNALMTLVEAHKRNLKINYTAYEAYPPTAELIQSLNYPDLIETEVIKGSFHQLHQCAWEEKQKLTPHFKIRKCQQDFEQIEAQSAFDIIYYDAFAPDAQPHLWEIPMLTKMYNALKPDGFLVTYCAKGSFKRNLKAIGFVVEALPGPPGKREMTRAVKEIQ